MKADAIEVGSTYVCTSPILKKQFQGAVEKLYESSALVIVSQTEAIDAERSEELNNRLIVSFSSFESLV
ncbi:hypothetical protein [Vagococcus fessus]|uniref:Uncharacterized protein n=1 Tax=Vagococcus fessus TaxID=120370 RepID=A0A430A7S3_9ENTE|nr:hypothetical protein [Vagococcus fessus]RSU03160.1 hypothetical protein CBF31_05435 [Vagococcus fessus]